jgi:pSer/pThr/pTyr-binding forkhead associated (FHA) protein
VAKIILTDKGSLRREVMLEKERITIGRRPDNDIFIDDMAVSAEHAVIVTICNDSILEDLNSTNGMQINGQPVKKHFLKDGDVIELAHYRLLYVVDGLCEGSAVTPPRVASQSVQTRSSSGKSEGRQRTSVIKILNGARATETITLTKSLTTIGRPGVQVAVVARRLQGYFLTHVEGEVFPLVNGESIGTGAHLLTYEDVIDLSGTQMKFTID